MDKKKFTETFGPRMAILKGRVKPERIKPIQMYILNIVDELRSITDKDQIEVIMFGLFSVICDLSQEHGIWDIKLPGLIPDHSNVAADVEWDIPTKEVIKEITKDFVDTLNIHPVCFNDLGNYGEDYGEFKECDICPFKVECEQLTRNEGTLDDEDEDDIAVPIPEQKIPTVVEKCKELGILNDLLENYSEEQINKMDAYDILDSWLEWEGVIGYSGRIVKIYNAIKELKGK